MKLDIPYYSQHRDAKDPYWKERSCGIVALYMLLAYAKKAPEDIDTLLKEGLEKGGFGRSGWIHQKLVELAESHGVLLARKEYKSDNKDEHARLFNVAVAEFVRSLESSAPVMVSAIKNFSEKDKFHLVILIGFERGANSILGFYYHDPDASDETDGAYKFVPFDLFKKHFRRLAIVPRV